MKNCFISIYRYKEFWQLKVTYRNFRSFAVAFGRVRWLPVKGGGVSMLLYHRVKCHKLLQNRLNLFQSLDTVEYRNSVQMWHQWLRKVHHEEEPIVLHRFQLESFWKQILFSRVNSKVDGPKIWNWTVFYMKSCSKVPLVDTLRFPVQKSHLWATILKESTKFP